MPRVSPASLRGFLFEEVLAFLIRRSGYSLLVSESQDPEALASRGNGLVVKGRGGDHQVDVLGELDWIPAFTFPLRLFLEAKFRGERTGIPTVRNAIGVLIDVNQRYTRTSAGPLLRRYRYAYALFSASGFSPQAVKMALAHEISLVDLSGRDYLPIREAISSSADDLLMEPVPDHASVEEVDLGDAPFVSSVRALLREELGTNPLGPQPLDESVLGLRAKLAGVIQAAKEVGDLFVGMAAGPYMLMMTATNRRAFLERMNQDPTLKVSIRWSLDSEGGRKWVIKPTEPQTRFELSFSIPGDIGDWIFSEEGGSTVKAMRFKHELLPHIFIPFKDDNGTNHLYRLDYSETSSAE